MADFNFTMDGLEDAQSIIEDKTSAMHEAALQGLTRIALMFHDKCVEYSRAGHPEGPDVQTGTLSGSFRVDMDEGGLVALVGTDTPYAPYVEYGHAQEPGRFVPAIGKRLVASFVQGYPFFWPAVIDVFDSGDAQAVFTNAIRDVIET